MKSVAVYCAVGSGYRPIYLQAAESFGRLLARREIGVVFGGASLGLMGAVADGALSEGGSVVGVIPDWMTEREIAHKRLSELHIVKSMHQRKAKMAELADGFVALPGGLGTMDEIFEMMTWQQLHIHDKPIGFLDVDGFFHHLFQLLQHAVNEGLLKPDRLAMAMRETDPDVLIDRMMAYTPVEADKWAVENRT